MRKILILVIIVLLIIPLNIYATSQYNIVGIGDSIMYGYTVDKNENYLSLITNEIQQNLGPDIKVNSTNLGINGLDSSGLLNVLNKNKSLIEYIKNADLIEISIGGNDTLLPVSEFVVSQMNLDITQNTTDVFSLIQGRTKELLDLDYKKIEPTMIKSRDNFNTRWPKIITRIKALNPEAKIIVVNTIDPYKSLDPIAKLVNSDFINTIDTVTDSINKEINDYSASKYDVIDISKPFDSIGGIVLTNLSRMDPHPNAAGHKLICALHRDILQKYKLVNKENTISFPFIGKVSLKDINPVIKDLRYSLKSFNLGDLVILTKSIDYRHLAQVLTEKLKKLII